MEEPQWMLHTPSDGDSCYTRPLLGSELFADQVMLFEHGFGECCMGITFTTSLTKEELCTKTKEALGRLRFFAPITAATLHAGIHDPQLRSWVYKPVRSVEYLQQWISEMLVVLDDPIDPPQFIQNMNATTLPYLLRGGESQYLRLYLIRPSSTLNNFGLFFHGTHALMDAHPTMVALSLLLEYITTPGLSDVASLSWGTEWHNLPAGPITSTGGPRAEWDVAGNALLSKAAQMYSNPTASTPPHSLKTGLRDIDVLGRPRRLLVELTTGETAAILKALKALGCTFTHLIEAAIALATYSLTPVESNNASNPHIIYGSSVISLVRNLVPPHRSKGHFISRFVLVPVTVPWAQVSNIADEKARLHKAMTSLKDQYAEYLGNPCLPHLMAEQMRLAPPRSGMPIANPYMATCSNLGNIEGAVPVLWPSPGAGNADAGHPREPPICRVSALHFGHRVTLPTPMIHIWTMHSRLFVQIQATDNWDEEILQKFMQEILRFVLLIVE